MRTGIALHNQGIYIESTKEKGSCMESTKKKGNANYLQVVPWVILVVASLTPLLALCAVHLVNVGSVSVVHHHQGSPSTQQKPIAGPRELLGPVRVCVAQNGVREWCI
jgi:hypothetical protein